MSFVRKWVGVRTKLKLFLQILSSREQYNMLIDVKGNTFCHRMAENAEAERS